MREMARMGYTSVIITSDSNKLADVPDLKRPMWTQEVEGMTIYWIKTMKYSVAKSLRRILSWLDFELKIWVYINNSNLPRPDTIIVSSLSLLTIINGLWWKWKYGCRLVLEIRDIWPLTAVEEGGFSRWNPLILGLGAIEWLGYRFADVIVGTMPNLSEHVQNILGERKTTYCIPMGVDEESLTSTQPLSEDYIKAYLPERKFTVVYAGTIGTTNAIETLVHCAETLQDHPDIHFLIVGDGDLRKQYIEKYSSLSNLTFAPRVPKHHVQSVLSRCDMSFFAVHTSSVWRYGQSLNKIIDYMLSGKPIVASYTGYPSMINEAGCGTYVPANDVAALRDEILRYLSMTQEERREMGRRGRDWILEHRRYDVLARKYLDILLPHKLCSKSS